MRVNCGWAELVDLDSYRPVARGCVYVFDPPLPCPTLGHWEGEVTLLRGGDTLAANDSSLWGMRFSDGRQLRWVEIRSIEPAWTLSGRHATALVVSCDDRFPAKVVELGGDA